MPSNLNKEETSYSHASGTNSARKLLRKFDDTPLTCSSSSSLNEPQDDNKQGESDLHVVKEIGNDCDNHNDSGGGTVKKIWGRLVQGVNSTTMQKHEHQALATAEVENIGSDAPSKAKIAPGMQLFHSLRDKASAVAHGEKLGNSARKAAMFRQSLSSSLSSGYEQVFAGPLNKIENDGDDEIEHDKDMQRLEKSLTSSHHDDKNAARQTQTQLSHQQRRPMHEQSENESLVLKVDHSTGGARYDTPPMTSPLKEETHESTSNDEGSNSAPSKEDKRNNDSTSKAQLSTTNTNKASAITCAINLANTVAGAGMLGLPGAFAGSGFVGGSILLVVASLFSANGLRLLSLAATKSGTTPHASFYSVANAALPGSTMLIDLAVALKCFGVATGYFITVGDCMVDAVRYFLRNSEILAAHDTAAATATTDGDETDSASLGMDDVDASGGWALLLQESLLSRHFWIMAGLIFVLPISFFKTLNSLKFASTLSLVLIFSLAAAVIMYALGLEDPCEGFQLIGGDHAAEAAEDLPTASDGRDLLFGHADLPPPPEGCVGETELLSDFIDTMKNLPVFIFSFTCHQNIFAVVNEIQNPTQLRVDCVIGTAIGAALLLYLAVAIAGYNTFGAFVDGDILLNYPQTALVTLMRVFISVMVMLSYPLQLDPSRRCIMSFVSSFTEWIGGCMSACRRSDEERERKKDTSTKKRTPGLNRISRKEGENDFEKGLLLTKASTDGSTHDVRNNIKDLQGRERSETQDDDHEEATKLAAVARDFTFNGITCVFLLFSFLIAMVVTDLGVILAVVGATGSTMVSYILPGILYIKLHSSSGSSASSACSKKYGWSCTLLVAYLQLFLGCLIVPTALYFVLVYGATA